MRKLATIRKINDITPIPDADKIECAHVDGWECVVSKADDFHVGDLVVYIEIDSIVPDKPEFEFLRNRKFRVKTIKLRGQVSQGLVLSTKILPPGSYKLGDDVTDILGIEKYDPEAEAEEKATASTQKKPDSKLVKWLMRFEWFREWRKRRWKNTSTAFPSWIHKTDEERIQNLPDLFEELKKSHTVLSVTEKVDGCSATYFLRKTHNKFGKKYDFGVCSRNKRIPTDNGSHYWAVAKRYYIENVLKNIIGDEEWVVLQGEITGAGIQGNKYPINNHFNLWAFNLIYPNKKYSTTEIKDKLLRYGIFTVPVVTNKYIVGENDTIQDMVEYVKGASQIIDREREGCVFRNIEKNISFKCINPDFLLKNDKE